MPTRMLELSPFALILSVMRMNLPVAGSYMVLGSDIVAKWPSPPKKLSRVA